MILSKMQKFNFGIELEIPLLKNGIYLDFDNTSFEELQSIIDQLPEYPDDYNSLRIGDLGIKKKRWYIEEYERYDTNGNYTNCDVKGIEIRTPICSSIDTAIKTLQNDRHLLAQIAQQSDITLTAVGFNPFKHHFTPKPPLNDWEVAERSLSPEAISADIHMLTQGPDVSISLQGLTDQEVIDIGKKITYYSPFIAPFSYNSPFYKGELWGGYSVRSYIRNQKRPAVLVFLKDKANLLISNPTLTEAARIPSETGRIELKAIDSVANIQIYGALLTLLKGLVLDTTLSERCIKPRGELHMIAAKQAFENNEIFQGSIQVVECAKRALGSDPDASRLDILEEILAQKITPAHSLIEAYQNNNDIITALQHNYQNTCVD
jgi:hypothetical protein